nr:hypothetical protein [Tanacetum cinerariifolium]
MRELREDTFSENKNDDAHEHVERVLDIVSLFNILGVSHDAVMMCIFPITLAGATKQWVDRLPPGTVDSWDLLKKPLSKGTFHHQKQPSSLKKSATSSRKETRLYTKPRNGIMTYYRNAPLMTLIAIRRYDEKSLIETVKNIVVKINKFLVPSDFVVMDMLNTHNETMILGRSFLTTIHTEIDVFNKEISLGIRGDRVTFDMNKKIHNFTTPIGEIYIINSTSNNEYTFHTSSDASSRVEKTDDLHNENNYCNQEQGQSCKKPRKLTFDINLPNTRFCKPVKQILKGELKFWPTCNPNIRECNGGPEIYGMDEERVIKMVLL